jgi:hypothetical protein
VPVLEGRTSATDISCLRMWASGKSHTPFPRRTSSQPARPITGPSRWPFAALNVNWSVGKGYRSEFCHDSTSLTGGGTEHIADDPDLATGFVDRLTD